MISLQPGLSGANHVQYIQCIHDVDDSSTEDESCDVKEERIYDRSCDVKEERSHDMDDRMSCDVTEEPPEMIDGMPLTVLSRETLRTISDRLNTQSQTIIPGRDHLGDYRGLAEVYGKQTPFIESLDRSADPTLELLKSLDDHDARLCVLWRNIFKLGRTDLLRECSRLFQRDTERWLNRQPRDPLEAESIKNEKKRKKIKDYFKLKASTATSSMSSSRNIPGLFGGTTGTGNKPKVNKPSKDSSGKRHGSSSPLSSGNVSSRPSVSEPLAVSSSSSPSSYIASPSSSSPSSYIASSSSNASSSSGAVASNALLTIDDVGSERPMYDAYVNCADEDIQYAKEMLQVLEQPPYNLRLFLEKRQLMPGGSKYEDVGAVVEERCRGKVVIILTQNYIRSKSEECLFVLNLARALDPASKRKKIIPVLYEHVGVMEMPRTLKGMYLISKLKDEKRGWYWNKLNEAILLA